MFVKDAVNPAGSHVHHHLRFLRTPRDAKGRSPGDAEYDPRTLTVVESEWEKICGSKMTNAVVQWWDLKKQYFDTVLLFKTGE
jgi:DNA mismatch repair protein MSH6